MNSAFGYLYDDFLSDHRYERDLSILETELARRGIGGHVGRLAMFRNAREIIVDMACAGTKNIVFVGNDKTLQKMMWFLPDVDVTIGYIPIQPSHIGDLLSIPLGIGAVDVLAARFIESLDVGKLDDRYFFTEVVVPSTTAALEIEGQYRVSPSEGGAIAIRNLGSVTGKFFVPADAKDGLLEAVIQTPVQNNKRWIGSPSISETHICLKQGQLISTEPMDVFMDGHAVNGFTFRLSIIPQKLKMITGRRGDLLR